MHTKSIFLNGAVLVLLLLMIRTCDCKKRVKFKRKVDSVKYLQENSLISKEKINNSTSSHGTGRGLGSLFGLGKVLNFFPVGGERECQPAGYTVARAGICLNPYDCRQRDGRAAGDCAHGLGVCCVFEVSCGGIAAHNLTYFLSPGFPELWTETPEAPDCTITIEKAFAGITQLRVDFVHFSIGQPNRITGECDEDAMILGEGVNNFTICGQNHGQHIYYDLPTTSETREAGDLPRTKSTRLRILMRGGDMPRLWLIRLAQLPLAQAAPHGCLQYFTNNNGTIKTFNYASNGRHLSGQDYKACIRRNSGTCTVRYSPCDPRSFRIGQPGGGGGSYGDPTVYYQTPGYGPVYQTSTTPRITTLADQPIAPPTSINDAMPSPSMPSMQMPADQMMPVMMDQEPANDEVEGSGDDPDIAPAANPTRPAGPGFFTRIWRLIWPFGSQGRSQGHAWPFGSQGSSQGRAWPFGSQGRAWRWSPYSQHYNLGTKQQDQDQDQPHSNFRYYGYGNFGAGLKGYGRMRCQDRVTIPCESEFFVGSSAFGPGVCDPHHCGSSFCPSLTPSACYVDTSIAPFAVSVHFGPPAPKDNPEANIGACLRFHQLPCES